MQLACILNQSLHVTNHGGQAVSKHNVNLVFMTCYQTLVPPAPPLRGLEFPKKKKKKIKKKKTSMDSYTPTATIN